MTTTAKPDLSRQAQTRMRLIDAAACEFAECGYQCATVRDICKRADANIAAVNYHFGDKQGLYAATLKHWIGVALEQYPLLMGVSVDAPATDRLKGFVRGTLHRMLDTGSAGWHGRLMAREMVEPTAAFDTLIDTSIRPMVDLLHEIVSELCGNSMSEAQTRRCAMSVIGQCCFYRHSREVVSRLFGPEIYSMQGVEEAAEHIARFSIAGCRQAAVSDRG